MLESGWVEEGWQDCPYERNVAHRTLEVTENGAVLHASLFV